MWWPVGHGKQPLYDFKVEIISEKTKIEKNKKIGIRKVYVKREQDEKGRSFEIHINNVPIFSKGANWIPADSFTTRLTKSDYEKLIIAAKDANMNTLRIWGGGIYEPEIFYELCDQYGIMVWQDFMFACSMYPADTEFLTSVEKEVRYQVARLKVIHVLFYGVVIMKLHLVGLAGVGKKSFLPKYTMIMKFFFINYYQICAMN